jgi:hypothetical protein
MIWNIFFSLPDRINIFFKKEFRTWNLKGMEKRPMMTSARARFAKNNKGIKFSRLNQKILLYSQLILSTNFLLIPVKVSHQIIYLSSVVKSKVLPKIIFDFR